MSGSDEVERQDGMIRRIDRKVTLVALRSFLLGSGELDFGV